MDNYELKRDFFQEIKRIKAKRANSARSASQRINAHAIKMQTFGLKSNIDMFTT